MDGFTRLELQALAEISDAQPTVAEALRAFFATARVTERINSGQGFFTSFTVDRSRAPLPGTWSPSDLSATFDVAVGGDVLLMDFLLWSDGGYPNCLEAAQFATRDGRHIDLRRFDLFSLSRVEN